VAVARVTLDQVARRAGVSRTTASFVLTGRRDMRISADAEERVTRAARELSYRPNLLARSLRTNLSHTIGMVSDVVATEPFAGDLVRGSMTSALLLERLMFVGETGGDAGVEQHLVQSMLDRGVDGFLYAAMYTRAVRPSPLLRGQALVLLNCVARQKGVPCVVPDDRSAGRTAARALLDAGHREGIYLVGETPANVLAARDRLAGVEAELAADGVALAGRVDTLWWPGAAHEAVGKLLASDVRPSALVCLNDRIALGAYQALGDVGLRAPSDVSLVSFDDSDLASWMDPGLDSVAIPHFEMGRRAVELLLADKRRSGVHRVVMGLHSRGSIAAPARPRSPVTRRVSPAGSAPRADAASRRR